MEFESEFDSDTLLQKGESCAFFSNGPDWSRLVQIFSPIQKHLFFLEWTQNNSKSRGNTVVASNGIVRQLPQAMGPMQQSVLLDQSIQTTKQENKRVSQWREQAV